MWMRFLVIAWLSPWVAVCCSGQGMMSGYQWPHKVMQGHLKDQAIFGFPTDVSQAVNHWMDTEAKYAFIEIFPESKTGIKHRLIGHIIDGGRIPKSILNEIAKKTGLPPAEIERRLRLYYKESIEKLASTVAKKYGTSLAKAKALVRFAAFIHILGDWSTSDPEGLQSVVRTISVMKKCIVTLLGKEKAKPYLKLLDKLLSKAKSMKLSKKETSIFILDGIGKAHLAIDEHLKVGRRNKMALKGRGVEGPGKRQVVKTRGKRTSRVVVRRARVRWKRAQAIRAGISRIKGGIGSAAMIAAPSLGGFRVGKTTMDVAVDAGVMLAGYSASQSASAMVAGTIGSGGAFAVAIVVQMVIAKIAYGFYERYQNVRREQRDIGVLKARIEILNHDDGLLDRMVERAIEQKNNFN